MTTEVEKLRQYCLDNNVISMGVTTAYSLGLSDHQPTAEEIARDINRVNEWLKDPVNNVLSRIGGLLFLKKDSIMCLERRTQILPDGTWEEIPLTDKDKSRLRNLKEDVEILEAAEAMIKELRTKNETVQNQ